MYNLRKVKSNLRRQHAATKICTESELHAELRAFTSDPLYVWGWWWRGGGGGAAVGLAAMMAFSLSILSDIYDLFLSDAFLIIFR